MVDWICIVCPAQVKHLRDLETSDWSAEFSWKGYQTKVTLIHLAMNHFVVQPLEDLDFGGFPHRNPHWIARSWQLKRFASDFCILPSVGTEDFRLSLHEVAPRWHDPSCRHAGNSEIARLNSAGFFLICSFLRACLWNDTLTLEGGSLWWNDDQTGDKPPPHGVV